MASTARQEALKTISTAKHKLDHVDFTTTHIKNKFAENVFNEEVAQARLPKPIFKALQKTIRKGMPLDPGIADAVATAMKDWAMDHGATHYTHIFQPLTGVTAEKHDSFLSPTMGGGAAVFEFSGKELVKGEPDASSFPSGGLRATFEARGYTAWDPTSPAYIIKNPNGSTLVIPTAFLSWTGEALDTKVPLLRSMEVLSTQALRILKLFGNTTAGHVFTTIGPEQEYFLIDKNFYYLRPDLIATGRTLFGALPPRARSWRTSTSGRSPPGCWRAWPTRVRAVQARRPGQDPPQRGGPQPVRDRPDLRELQPGDRPPEPDDGDPPPHGRQVRPGVPDAREAVRRREREREAQQLVDVDRHRREPAQPRRQPPRQRPVPGLLRRHRPGRRQVQRHPPPQHRLGRQRPPPRRQRAPPAIISVFLGDQLQDIFNQLETGPAKSSKQGGTFVTGVSVLPPLPKEAGDRNRTSPFAFTGNRFEFRAVGSSANIGMPNTVLNTIVAESLDYMATKLEADVKAGKDLNTAIQELLPPIVKESKKVLFNGNGYAEEWHAEAAKRGLTNFKSTTDVLPVIKRKDTVELFAKYKVFTEKELESRFNVLCENYVKQVNIEAKTVLMMAKTMILPTALRYQKEVADSVAAAKAAGATSEAGTESLSALVSTTNDLSRSIKALEKAAAHGDDDAYAHAKHIKEHVIPIMLDIRKAADTLEATVSDDLWPLPTYREMLFLK